MPQMTHTERIKAAINFEEVDRVPAGIWGHRPLPSRIPSIWRRPNWISP